MSVQFAIVDVETTHGDPQKAHLIEVAAIVHDGMQELDRWNTLVRPRTEVPLFIQRLTGIVPDMLGTAPLFPDVARSLQITTAGRIMVAHNVRYDMTVLQHEFARTGLAFHPDTLCTERLCRQLMPGRFYYNLASVCRYAGITTGHRHRAAHDAQATLSLLLHLIHEHGLDRVLSAVMPAAGAFAATA